MERDKPSDPGGYIGHEPELASETIPGGVGPDDERVAGTATQSTGEGAARRRPDSGAPPEGHRQGSRASDDDVRRAGESG
jgi:hypothetical protein